MSQPTVCVPCKRRKKSCDKQIPSCSRCLRLLVKCCYPTITPPHEHDRLPTLFNKIQDQNQRGDVSQISSYPTTVTVRSPKCSPLFLSLPFSAFTVCPPRPLSLHHVLTTQIAHQATLLLHTVSRGDMNLIHAYTRAYFSTFHFCLPFVSSADFYRQLKSVNTTSDTHITVLLISMMLITQIYPLQSGLEDTEEGNDEDLYLMLKGLYAMLQGTQKYSIEMLQAGLHIAAWEHNKGMVEDAWLSIGGCVRMGLRLGLDALIKVPLPVEEGARRELEARRCVWWGCVVLERVIHGLHSNTLPSLRCIAPFPSPHDYLPLVPPHIDPQVHITEDMLLPSMLSSDLGPYTSRGFTRFGTFASTIQALYLLELVTEHCRNSRLMNRENRRIEVRKLDLCLKHLSGAFIPPPGKAAGHYCGGYSFFSLALHKLTSNEIAIEIEDGFEVNEQTSWPLMSLLSDIRLMIATCKATKSGVRMDWDSVAFWAHHTGYDTAMLHIKWARRDEDWDDDIDAMVDYMQYYLPRNRLVAIFIESIVKARRERLESEGNVAPMPLAT